MSLCAAWLSALAPIVLPAPHSAHLPVCRRQVTVLSVFQRLNADEDLYALVFGESVRSPSDGVAPSRSCTRETLSHDAFPPSFHAVTSPALLTFQIQRNIEDQTLMMK